ncbi:hypothetical protein FA13DRAFT_1744338 [Coprinellus micaceus]|uniref:Uncharacterized protein n=1 Tax=Coprinellus micaceus TaxID=71717 RepID=A0A4Y7SDK3_COPMI|nr:hypothetical protein FA13DRAFT_1744338 [Coprinellus micaceus]
MILDDKVIMSLSPPPPYLANGVAFGNPPPPFSEAIHGQPARPLKLSALPSHILLQIVYNTFPTRPSLNAGLGEMQRKILLYLAKSLRLVNKAFYIACMHVLRSTYIPAYTSLLRPFYSSDPFPSTVVPQSHWSSLNTVQRETPVLDLFIALKVREDVCVDDSELHLEREDMFKDIFDHSQPKARLEDLVRIYGVKEGVITLSPPGVVVYTTSTPASSNYSSLSSDDETIIATDRKPTLPLPSPTLRQQPRAPTKLCPPKKASKSFFSAFRRSKTPSPPATFVPPQPKRIRPLPFALLSISYSTRKVGLQTIVEVQRMSRDERLETVAARVVGELRSLLVG